MGNQISDFKTISICMPVACSSVDTTEPISTKCTPNNMGTLGQHIWAQEVTLKKTLKKI